MNRLNRLLLVLALSSLLACSNSSLQPAGTVAGEITPSLSTIPLPAQTGASAALPAQCQQPLKQYSAAELGAMTVEQLQAAAVVKLEYERDCGGM